MLYRSASNSKWSPGIVPLRSLARIYGVVDQKELNFRSVELPVQWLLAVSCRPTAVRNSVLEHLCRHDFLPLPSLVSLDSEQPVDDLIQDYLLASVLKKSVNMKVDSDPELVAREVSLWAENECRRSNERFSSFSFSARTKNILSSARDIFRKVLGPFNENEIFSLCRFGPGTSSSCRKSNIHLYGKLSADIDVTDSAYSWMSELLTVRPDLTVQAMDSTVYFPDLTYSIGGIMRFVDKTAKVKRQIVVEPHGNMCLQLGAGSFIANRLTLAGLPKHRQAAKNQQLAFESSITDRLATWDLKCGSGIICKSLVHYLADPSWRNFLDDIRSHYVYEEIKLDSGLACSLPIHLEKFSEMGNGFTFELETLVFWSLMRASLIYDGISDKDSYVFGDDLLFPKEGCPGMLKLFNEVGFTVNLDKSFSEGPFRESCGGDFYKGNYVRPFFLKEERYDVCALIGVANKLRRWAARCTLYGSANGTLLTEVDAPFCDNRARLAWLYIVDLLKRSHIPIVCGSYDRGDTVLWANPLEDSYFDSSGYTYVREQSRINIGNYQKAAYLAALNNSYSSEIYYTGKRYHYIYKPAVLPGSLPKVRRPDQAMRSLCVNTDAYLGPYDAPKWL